MTEIKKDVTAWRIALRQDPEVQKFGQLMFHHMEAGVFRQLDAYINAEGREMAAEMSSYGQARGYDFTEEEVLAGLRTAAPEIREMVRKSWEKVLGAYLTGAIQRGQTAGRKE